MSGFDASSETILLNESWLENRTNDFACHESCARFFVDILGRELNSAEDELEHGLKRGASYLPMGEIFKVLWVYKDPMKNEQNHNRLLTIWHPIDEIPRPLVLQKRLDDFVPSSPEANKELAGLRKMIRSRKDSIYLRIVELTSEIAKLQEEAIKFDQIYETLAKRVGRAKLFMRCPCGELLDSAMGFCDGCGETAVYGCEAEATCLKLCAKCYALATGSDVLYNEFCGYICLFGHVGARHIKQVNRIITKRIKTNWRCKIIHQKIHLFGAEGFETSDFGDLEEKIVLHKNADGND